MHADLFLERSLTRHSVACCKILEICDFHLREFHISHHLLAHASRRPPQADRPPQTHLPTVNMRRTLVCGQSSWQLRLPVSLMTMTLWCIANGNVTVTDAAQTPTITNRQQQVVIRARNGWTMAM